MLRGTLVQGNDGNFYGASERGPKGGTVFKITTNGEWSILASLDVGYNPEAGLVLGADGNLYGTTAYNSFSNNLGTIFKVTTNGVWTTLATFHGYDGVDPSAKLIQGRDGNLYGTTSWGRSGGGEGVVFRVTTNGILTAVASFDGTNGSNPRAGLVEGDDGIFYGTTYTGGSYGLGTVFKVTAAGVLTTLVSFDGTNGSYPLAGLMRGNDGNFYGTAGEAGSNTIFKVGPDGGLTTLLWFANTNGTLPYAELTQDKAGNLYGTTYDYGTKGNISMHDIGGTMFEATTDGVFTTLIYFNSAAYGHPCGGLLLGADGYLYGLTQDQSMYKVATNGTVSALFPIMETNGVNPGVPLTPDGKGGFYYPFGNKIFQVKTDGVFTPFATFTNPITGNPIVNGPSDELLVGRDGNLYGTMASGFPLPGDEGGVFKVGTNGAVTILATFNITNGEDPQGVLVEGDDGVFYGTTTHGGSVTNLGTIFKVTSNGALTTLVSFNGTNGAWPYTGLTRGADGNLYGTTSSGGNIYNGTVFKMTPDDTLTTLVSLGGTYGDSAHPDTELIQGADGNFYGTTSGGGFDGSGTVFSVTPNGMLKTLVYFGGAPSGSHPSGRLHQGSDGNFYGSTSAGGYYNGGSLFQVTTNGVLSTLAVFNQATGILPFSGLVQGPDGNFYSFSSQFGPLGAGAFLRIGAAPILSISTTQSSSGPVITGKGLPNESCRIWTATDPSLPFASWTYLGSGALDGAGNFSYTNAATGANSSGFYRLSIP